MILIHKSQKIVIQQTLLFTLPDSTADRVIDEKITPQFRTPSGATTKPQASSKQYSVFKRKCLERVISTLQLRIESSSQLSLINPFTQVLKSVSQQLKNSLKKVSEKTPESINRFGILAVKLNLKFTNS